MKIHHLGLSGIEWMIWWSVEFYYHKMKNLWDEYTALEPTITCKCNCKCDSHKQLEDREEEEAFTVFNGIKWKFFYSKGPDPYDSYVLNVALAGCIKAP